MRRSKRLTIIRTGLALAALAMIIPTAALGKPLPRDPIQAEYQARAYELRDPIQAEYQARAYSIPTQSVEIPYLSGGAGVSEIQLGIVSSTSPDDRSLARTYDEQPVLVSDDGSSFDVNPFAVTGFGLVLVLMAGGMGLAIRHNRKSKLSPA